MILQEVSHPLQVGDELLLSTGRAYDIINSVR
jgi:hypothetical protein